MIYVILLDDGTVVYARGEDKHEAWGKVHFEGSMTDSMTQDEFDAKFAPPVVL